MIKVTQPGELLHLNYLFANKVDPQTAAENLLRCDRIIFTESLQEGLSHVSADTGIQLPVFHTRANPAPVVDRLTTELLLDLLDPEYEVLERLARYHPVPAGLLERRYYQEEITAGSRAAR